VLMGAPQKQSQFPSRVCSVPVRASSAGGETGGASVPRRLPAGACLSGNALRRHYERLGARKTNPILRPGARLRIGRRRLWPDAGGEMRKTNPICPGRRRLTEQIVRNEAKLGATGVCGQRRLSCGPWLARGVKRAKRSQFDPSARQWARTGGPRCPRRRAIVQNEPNLPRVGAWPPGRPRRGRAVGAGLKPAPTRRNLVPRAKSKCDFPPGGRRGKMDTW
jgi:hypothetical protein